MIMPDSVTPTRPAPETDADVIAVSRLDAVQLILRVLSRTTGLRIAVVARVTKESWTACAVLDNTGFGLKVGDQLDLHTTY
jgi:hypothetical protein